MSQPTRVGSLEIDQNLGFQQKEWRAQRIGWVVMALMALAALIGLTGHGVLAQATAGDPDALLRLAYARFDRVQAPSTLEVQIAGDAITGEQIALWVDRDYIQSVLIEKVVPEPHEVRVAADGLLYTFAVAEPGRPITVTFEIRHTSFGAKSGRIALADGPALAFGQFVYP